MNVIIVGGGQVGGYIAGLLIENGNNAIVIENKEKALQALKKNGLKKENVAMLIPHGETVIRAGQYILAVADEAAVEELNRIFGAKE